MAKAKTAQEFDRRFDDGEDIFDLADVDEGDVRRPGLESQRINLDLPRHFLEKLDREAKIRGITRQSLIKTWLYERLEGVKAGGKPKVKAGPRFQILLGVVERARPNDRWGKRFYLADIGGLELQTTDPQLGEALFRAEGRQIKAQAEPVPGKPGSFYLKSLESLEVAAREAAAKVIAQEAAEGHDLPS
jgi:hypothetical protein